MTLPKNKSFFPKSIRDIKDLLRNTRIVIVFLFVIGSLLFLMLFLDSHYKQLFADVISASAEASKTPATPAFH